MACGIDHDQRTADAVARVRLERQWLLQLDADLADVVDGELVRVDRLQRVDVEPVLDGADARLHPAVGVAHPVAAADLRRLGVEPGQGGCERAALVPRTRCRDPVAA